MTKSKIIIYVVFGIILILVSLLVIIGVTNLEKSKSHLDHIVKTNNMKIQLATQMYKAARERTVSLQQMFIIVDDATKEKAREKMAYFGGEFVTSRDKLLRLNLSIKEK